MNFNYTAFTSGVFIQKYYWKLFFVSGVFAFQPEFSEPLANLTVAVGRDATFTCMVQHLGGYRVCKKFY